MFFEGSRYADVGEHTITDARGRTLRYKKVRVIGPASVRWRHVVSQGERLDHVAQRYYRDPERFWRICDLNDVLWPGEATAEPGVLLGIPAPEE